MFRHLVGLTVLVCTIGIANAADTDKDDLEKLVGKWVMTGMRVEGKVKEEKSEKSGIVFQKDMKALMLEKGKPDAEATFKIDASKKPKQIDIVSDENKKKVTQQCIYQLKGDVLELAMPFGAAKRPTSFEGNDELVMIFKRQKK